MAKTLKHGAFMAFFILSASAHAADSPLYFLWDIGTVEDRADPGDFILDLAQPCNSSEIAIHFPGRIAPGLLPEIAIPAASATKELFERFELNLPAEKCFKLVRVFDSYRGKDGQVVVLLPEIHKAVNDESAKRHFLLQFVRSYFVVAFMGEIQKESISALNLREGIEGSQILMADGSLDQGHHLTKMSQLAERGYPAAFDAIGNIFAQAQNVFSAYLEQSNLIYTDVLLNLSSFNGKMSFEETLRQAEKFYGQNLNHLAVKETYEKLARLSPSERLFAKETVCVVRGEQMAQKTLSLARTRNAKVIFLSYGASHHKEITDYLMEREVTYVGLLGHIEEYL